MSILCLFKNKWFVMGVINEKQIPFMLKQKGDVL